MFMTQPPLIAKARMSARNIDQQFSPMMPAKKKLPAAQKRLAAAQANLAKVQATIDAAKTEEERAKKAAADHTLHQATLAEMEAELKQQVRSEIGAIATPDIIHFTPSLPKTRSGKIMRRILRKIAEGRYDQLGDTSTLAEPEVVDSLVEGRKERLG